MSKTFKRVSHHTKRQNVSVCFILMLNKINKIYLKNLTFGEILSVAAAISSPGVTWTLLQYPHFLAVSAIFFLFLAMCMRERMN